MFWWDIAANYHDFPCIYIYTFLCKHLGDINISKKMHSSSFFLIKYLGALKYFLGIVFAHSSGSIFLCPRKNALDILSEFGMLGAWPCSFPMEQHHCLQATLVIPSLILLHICVLLGDRFIFSITRPELTYFVHILS